MDNGLPGKKLPPEFYLQDTVQVARQLIGKLLVRRVEGQTLSAIICETEAYTGFSDKACHSYKGSSPRTRVMFEVGGKAYVYLIYGMYSCLNVTTREEGVPEAVLIRAASPVEGIERMMQLRQSKKPIKSLKENTLLSGPGGCAMRLPLPANKTVCRFAAMSCLSAKEWSCHSSRLLPPRASTSTMHRKQRIICIALWILKALVFQ